MKLKDKMLALGYSPKSEFVKLFLIELVFIIGGAAIVYFLKNYIYGAFALGFGLIVAIIYLSRYGSQLNVQNAKNLEEFTNLFSYFRIYIHNGFSVYTALKEIESFANPSLQKNLETLLSDIDNDKSVQPFVKFARNFNEIIIEEMMISIYQMIDDGEQSDYLRQFEMIFDKFSDIQHQNNLHKKDSKLGTFASAPLIGSCYLIIVLTIGIVNIIGGMISGI